MRGPTRQSKNLVLFLRLLLFVLRHSFLGIHLFASWCKTVSRVEFDALNCINMLYLAKVKRKAWLLYALQRSQELCPQIRGFLQLFQQMCSDLLAILTLCVHLCREIWGGLPYILHVVICSNRKRNRRWSGKSSSLIITIFTTYDYTFTVIPGFQGSPNTTYLCN